MSDPSKTIHSIKHTISIEYTAQYTTEEGRNVRNRKHTLRKSGTDQYTTQEGRNTINQGFGTRAKIKISIYIILKYLHHTTNKTE